VDKKGLFGTSGIRGDAKELFTQQFCFDIGRSFALFLKAEGAKGIVALGMDPRESSPRILSDVTKGIVYEELSISCQGVVPIPAMNYILKVSDEFIGSIMISGSHIKPHLNGLKFFCDKEEITKSQEKKIEELYEEIKGEKNSEYSGELEYETGNRAKEEYINYLLDNSKKDKYPKWKVVVDAGNGAQSDVMPEVLRLCGLEVIENNCSIQEQFFSRDTEVEGDLVDLQKAVLENKADFGVGYDSDGDRCVFIDDEGKFIPGDYTGALLAKYFGKGKAVTPINSSQVIDRMGVTVERTKVGSPYVVAKMKEKNIPFGYEANGGCVFIEMPSRDGGRTTIEVLNVISESGKSLREVVSGMPKYYIKRDKVEYEWSMQETILNRAKEEFKGIKTEDLDGLKIWIDDKTWILFRSSQNAPEFRVFVESEDNDKAESLMQKGLDLVKKITEEK